MGRADARALDAGLHVGGSRRARRRAGARRGCWARTSSRSATPTAGSACVDEHCPHRRASLALGRNEECGLRCLYHGWKIDVDGNVVEMPSEPRGKLSRAKGQAQGLSVPRGRRLRLGLDGRPDDCAARSSRPAWAPSPRHAHQHRQDRTSTATGRRCSKARSTRRTARRCIRPTCRRRASTAPSATATVWPRPSTDKAPRLQVQRDRLRLPLRRRSAARSRTPPRTTTCASRCSSRRSPC